MKRTVVLLSLIAVLCGVFSSHSRAAQQKEQARPGSKTLEFLNGQWFDGATFHRGHFYSVDGKLTSRKPQHIDEVIDLGNGYLVPPFGDAHNHYIAGPHDIKKILDQYLEDGIFYAKNPASI